MRAEKKVLVSFNGASVAAATVWGVTAVISEEPAASRKKVVDPFGDDYTLIGIKTAESRAVGGPVNRLPELVSPLIAILEVSPERGGE